MKNFKPFFKTHLLAAFVFLSVNFGFAQSPTVQVPSTCNVVVAGTQGITGLGGRVGNGGIVSMPDPFAAATFTFLPNNTVTPLVTNTVGGWSLSGDLSVQTGTVAGAVIQPTGTPTSILLQSYNKRLRTPSENTTPSVSSWARSKGVVTINYTSNGGGNNCGLAIRFEVFKNYTPTGTPPTNLPIIIGPDCLLPNLTYTYSVDQIASDNLTDNIGLDSYYWSGLPIGSFNAYTSADKSSITFTMGATITTPIILKCCYGRANPWDSDPNGTGATSCVTKNINPVPFAPTFLSNPLTVGLNCLPTGTTTYTNTISALAGYTYVWTCSNTAWNLVQSGTQNSVLTITNFDNNPGTLTLTITNGSCNPVDFKYIINRTLATGLGITAVGGGIPVTCISANTDYSLPQNALGNQTNWTIDTVPTGGTLPAGAPTVVNGTGPGSTCTVTPGTTAGQFALVATSTATTSCTSTNTRIIINIRPGTPTTITPASGSSFCLVKGALTAQTYNCTAVSGASYLWSFPSGWTATNFTTSTNSILVTPANATAVLNGNVTVTAIGTNGCNGGTSTTSVINYNAIAPSGITFANSCFNFGIATTSTFTVNNAPSPFYGSYTITSVPTGLFTSTSVNATTGVISFTTAATASGTYAITVQHTTASCTNASNSTAFNVTISSNGTTIPAPTATSFNPALNECDTYLVTNRPAGSNNTNTQWFLNGGSALVSNGTTVFINPSASQLQLCGANTTITSVCVQVTSGGCTTRVCAGSVGTHGTARLATNTLNSIAIYPNPNKGNFTIKVDSFKNEASATVTDISGKLIGIYKLKKGENNIVNNGIAAGTYFVNLAIDGKKESRKIIIE